MSSPVAAIADRDSASSDPLLGAPVARFFRIERKLAEGGMGIVYVARHESLAIQKVIKVLLPHHAEQPALRARFQREAVAASLLEHENILGIDNFGVLDDGQPFLMVPYLEGMPLDALLRSRGGRLEPRLASHFALQLLGALSHAHTIGVVHRDIKPSNIWVLPDRRIKLLDFGIAKVRAEPRADGLHTHTGQGLGTPSYMAVEQYEHAHDATHLADLYSVAIVVWEMMTGRLPWGLHDPWVLYHKQLTETPQRPPESEMPGACADALLQTLQVDPARRLQSARELAVALAAGIAATPREPGGAEMMARLARTFIEHAPPAGGTVHDAADPDRMALLLWPPRDVRAGLPPFESPTTVTASSGVPVASPAPRNARWKLVIAGVTAAALAAVTTLGVARGVASHEGSEATAPVPAASSRPAEVTETPARPQPSPTLDPSPPLRPRTSGNRSAAPPPTTLTRTGSRPAAPARGTTVARPAPVPSSGSDAYNPNDVVGE